MKRILAAVVLFASLTACKPTNMNAPDMPPPLGRDGNPRFTVQRVGVFEDDIAYCSRRGIYILHDAKTERDYIGISGVGISEMGSHAEGKTTVADEQ